MFWHYNEYFPNDGPLKSFKPSWPSISQIVKPLLLIWWPNNHKRFLKMWEKSLGSWSLFIRVIGVTVIDIEGEIRLPRGVWTNYWQKHTFQQKSFAFTNWLPAKTTHDRGKFIWADKSCLYFSSFLNYFVTRSVWVWMNWNTLISYPFTRVLWNSEAAVEGLLRGHLVVMLIIGSFIETGKGPTSQRRTLKGFV